MGFLSKLNIAGKEISAALQGDDAPLSKDFFLKHGRQVFVCIIVALAYINLRYECEETIYRINSLKQELIDVRYLSIARWGELTGKNKPDIIRKKVAKSNIELISTDEPAIWIK